VQAHTVAIDRGKTGRNVIVLLVEDATSQSGGHDENASASADTIQAGLFANRYGFDEGGPQEDFDFIELVIADDLSISSVMRAKLRRISPRTYIGSGKVNEVAETVRRLRPDAVVTNGQLSPVHQRNLEEEWSTTVLTRADIIFDIFERNASTSEGKLQVELARLSYELPRVTGIGKELSRTGGDMGTRGGGGEQVTAMTKDRIRKRIRQLETRVEKLKKVRELRRKRRVRAGMFTVSLIGYTNSGKSSLLNALTKSDAEVAERYFTTLDPTSRSLYLGSGTRIVLSDTVGFLNDLPTELSAAFRATMEEVAESDLLLHVVDASRENVAFRLESGSRILEEYGFSAIPRVVVFNKIDLLDDEEHLARLQEQVTGSVAVSAHTGNGLDKLMQVLCDEAETRVTD
jgi:GTP-binding protein HflX